MYRMSVPISILSKEYDKEKVLHDLRLLGADRIFLSVGSFPYDSSEREKVFSALRESVEYFKKTELEVGVWLWAFMVDGESPFTPITGFDGTKSSVQKCPSDPAFIDFCQYNIRTVAQMKPDLIMFDDDIRYGYIDSGFGCCCENHMKALEKEVGIIPEKEALFDALFRTKPNKLRSAFLKGCGDSIKHFAYKMREAVDSVDESIRLGACSVMSLWDTDGVDSYTVTKILAGKTKPFLRLIGAPYWAELKAWGNRIQDVIELERMQSSWRDDENIEIFSEGDVYPRPRYSVASAYVEIFDTALRASTELDGIHKYIIDYTSSSDYERGYIKRHLKNKPLYQKIQEMFSDTKAYGVRVYESMKKLETADLTGRKNNIPDMFFSQGARLLASNGIPSCYKGSGCAGICFGDNTDALSDESFKKPLILDIISAKALSDKGIDVGIEAFGEWQKTNLEYFCVQNEHIAVNDGKESVCRVSLKDGATVLSTAENKDDGTVLCFSYENNDGNRFLVYTFDSGIMTQRFYRNYCRPVQICNTLKKWDCTIPAVCFGQPDLYIMYKRSETKTVIGIWNCFADALEDGVVRLAEGFSSAEFVNGSGKLLNGDLYLGRIEPFGYMFVQLN